MVSLHLVDDPCISDIQALTYYDDNRLYLTAFVWHKASAVPSRRDGIYPTLINIDAVMQKVSDIFDSCLLTKLNFGLL